MDILAGLFVLVEAPPLLLCSCKFLVPDDSLIFEGDWQIPEKGTESLVEKPLVDGCANEDNDHDDRLALTGRTVSVTVFVSAAYEKEKSDQAQLHKVESSEKLVDRCWIQQTSRVEAKFSNVKRVVSVDKPEEAEGDDIKDEDERTDDGVDNTYIYFG